ncbi:hypothetical protein EMQ25_15360 [Arsenicitalea aurantiaca]|uniref:Uncharacterized protein n=1 Tax=Arsenicitalea aurantiaca TaxID=1783274 RepID=A0A433X3W7_9HYPH|nr:DUF6384 family protein [Arsenicitalea aurantiaca]RUT28767.1 hypothetical protein EMQ25_15360 [Arsenicitalea aurantiaca]
MTSAALPPKAPLDDVMLAMDVVDTLRHRQDLVTRELEGVNRESQLIERLRDLYHQQGIEVPDHILKEGVAALAESRFTYEPPRPSLQLRLARLYVTRARWGRPVAAGLIALLLGVGGYFLAYKPFVAAQSEAARVELAEGLPQRMDEVYDAIYNETKVQQAVTQAAQLRERGKTAAAAGERASAERALAGMTDILDTLRREYSLRIVNREGVQSGFWTFPEINTDATNYYVVVEAIGPEGEPLALPILNEETGETQTVTLWGVRVPEAVYASVEADKRDDGIIQRNVVGLKQYGFLEVDYLMPVSGGAVTQW